VVRPLGNQVPEWALALINGSGIAVVEEDHHGDHNP